MIKKAGDSDTKSKIKGCWDSIHVVEVQEKSSGRSAHYKLTSTSMLWLQTNKARSGTMNLGGSLTRQVEQDASVSEASPHIANIGEALVLSRQEVLLLQVVWWRTWRTRSGTPSMKSTLAKPRTL